MRFAIIPPGPPAASAAVPARGLPGAIVRAAHAWSRGVCVHVPVDCAAHQGREGRLKKYENRREPVNIYEIYDNQ